jgi:serine/threonine protein kinase
MSSKNHHVGDYPLIRLLGKGGMGSVWLSHHPILDIPLAIKILQVKNQDNAAEYRKRFIQEGLLAASIDHPNLLRIYDAGVDEANHYLAMEFIDGEDMGKLLKRHPDGLPNQQVIESAIMITEALNSAHQKGIVHRDLKPENILITKSGSLKLADLGIAKNLEDRNGVTTTGVALGTPHYIAPEQALNATNADQRSDIYTLGATLYHLITGTTPYIGNTPLQVMMQHVQEPLEHPQSRNATADTQLCSVICKMMEKRPEMRYQNCSELLKDLQIIDQGKGTLSSESPFDSLNGSMPTKKQTKKKKPYTLITTLSFACLVALFFLLQNDNEPSTTEPLITSAEIPPTIPVKSPSQITPPKRIPIKTKTIAHKLTSSLTQALKRLQSQNPIPTIGSEKFTIAHSKISLDLSDNMGLKDIAALQDLPIEKINLNSTSVTNINTLKNCGIKELHAHNLEFDLRQLEGFQLTHLKLGYIDDLSHLPKLPLKKLEMIHFSGSSLKILNSLTLDELIISAGASNFLPKGPIHLKGLEIQRFISRNTPK